jgi:late competence protein required for DNA uptake (superfamily II DNA/RNA helicase)
MIYTGNLIKMKSELSDPVTYTLNLSGQKISMNELIGKELSISFQHKIHCIKCGRETKTSFAQGYCYPCFVSARKPKIVYYARSCAKPMRELPET